MTGYLYYPAEEFGFDIAKDHPAIARLARAHEGAARLGASLRSDARLSVRHAAAIAISDRDGDVAVRVTVVMAVT